MFFICLGFSIFSFTDQNGMGNTCITLNALNVDSADNIFIATSVSTGSSPYFGIYIAKLDRNGNLVTDFGKNGIARVLTDDGRYEIEIKKMILINNKIFD